MLALDTSTVVNVGLARGDRVLATATVADQMAHVEQLMPLVSECLDAAGAQVRDLEQVVVGLGPGPFTGLRVGVVTAQVLGQVLGLELRGVCSLDVVAAQFAGAIPRSSWLPPMPGDARCTGLAIARTAYDSETREYRSLARCRGWRPSDPQLIFTQINWMRCRVHDRWIRLFLRAAVRRFPTSALSRCICAIPTRPSSSGPSRCCTTQACGDDPRLPQSGDQHLGGTPG